MGAARFLGLAIAAAPDQIGIKPYGGIATAPGAAFNGFEQESVLVLAAQLEVGRNRREQVIGARGAQDNRLALIITLGGRSEIGRDPGPRCRPHCWSSARPSA